MLSLNFLSPVPSLIPPFLVLLLLFRLLLLGLCHRFLPALFEYWHSLGLYPCWTSFLSSPLHCPRQPYMCQYSPQLHIMTFCLTSKFISHHSTLHIVNDSSLRYTLYFALIRLLTPSVSLYLWPHCLESPPPGFISWWPRTEEPLPLTSFDGVSHCYIPSAPSTSPAVLMLNEIFIFPVRLWAM